MTDTRQWELRPGVWPEALTALETAGSRPAAASGVKVGASWVAALGMPVDSLGASSGGWAAGAGSRGGAQPLGEEIR